MKRALSCAPDPVDVLAAAADIGFEELLAWITHGPPRPPDSREELEAWLRAPEHAQEPPARVGGSRRRGRRPAAPARSGGARKMAR